MTTGVRKQPPLLGVLAALVFITACQTAPKLADPLEDNGGLIPLESGALVYVLADVPRARAILDAIPLRDADKKQIAPLLDRTRSAAAALYPRESGRRLQIAAWGNYPSGLANAAFAAGRNWKKTRGKGYSYWHSDANNFSVLVNAKQAFVVSADAAADPVCHAPPVQSPDDFIELNKDSVFSCWFENPGETAARMFTALDLPLELPARRMYAGFFPAEDSGGRQFRAVLTIEAMEESQARALVTLFSMARVFTLRMPAEEGAASLAAVLFANAPAQNGKYVSVETAALGEKELALLFSFFSLY